MIRASGVASYLVRYHLDIDMTQNEWDEAPADKQKEIIDEMIGIGELESAEMNDCDVWDVLTLPKAND